MSKKCQKCKSKDIHITEYPTPADNIATCYGCGYVDLVDRFPEQTFFDYITTSPEVLAKEFVEKQEDQWDDDDYSYYSYLTKEWYATESKALAATVAKLKEVWK